MKAKLIIVAVAVCSCTLAKAQGPITPAQLMAAEDVLVASNASMQFQSNITSMLKQASINVPEDKRTAFMEAMNKFMVKYISWDQIKDQLASIYAQEFTEKELHDLAVFYRTSLGKKLNEKQPVIFQKSSVLGQQAVQLHQADLQQMMQDAFKQQQ